MPGNSNNKNPIQQNKNNIINDIHVSQSKSQNNKSKEKNLDYFFKEDSIKKEIENWSKEDLTNYIKKESGVYKSYSKARFISKAVSEERLKIVKMQYLKKYGNELKTGKDLDLRKCFSVEELVPYAPDNVKDTQEMKKAKDFDNKINTGVYLWKHGYDVDKYIGNGCTAVFWSLKGGQKGIKVTCSGKKGDGTTLYEYNVLNNLSKEIESHKANDPNFKYADRYLNINRPVGKNAGDKAPDKAPYTKKYLFEAEKAEGDIYKYVRETRKLDEIITMTKNIFKGIRALHELGYSHNDICPENVLYLNKTINEVKQYENKQSVDPKSQSKTKTKFQLADFNACTKINSGKKRCAGRKGYCCPGHHRMFKPEEVERKDVYSGGCVILHALLQLEELPSDENQKDFANLGPQIICDKYGLLTKYGEENKMKIYTLIALIKMFLQPVTHRPDTKTALQLVTQSLSKVK